MITVTKSDLPKMDDYIYYLKKIWENDWLTNDGNLLHMLEMKLSDYLRISNFVAVSNGTLAIQIVLKALKVHSDVITTPFTFSATTNALVWEGLNPIFADIDPKTFNIDHRDVEDKITDKTSAILAVHVYGNPCNLKKLHKIANEYGLKLIYDAAHAFGVECNGNSVLGYGDASTISFHATKIFHTIEGGGITVNNKEIFETLKLLRNHGIKSEDKIVLPGTNAKMNEFQAAMGICNLETIGKNIEKRKELYERYKENLNDLDVTFQKVVASKYNYSYMPVCFENKKTRDKVYERLSKDNIYSRRYFYPLTPNFDYFNDSGNIIKKYGLETALKVSNRVLCLPLYPDLGLESVDMISDKIKELNK
jgi:dTDP-4-amino-4,6-dideoxygalactose transaminase